jgi:PilZ domain-containing protein
MTNGSPRLDGPYSERRAVPRFNFIATAEIVEPVSDTHMSGRVSEISSKGCFVDLLNTLPKDTPIRVHITTDHGSFECEGTIIYVQDRMGMGVAFARPSNEQQCVLDAWLADLEHA